MYASFRIKDGIMIRNPIDITVSPELAKLIGSRAGDPGMDEPVTLGSLRNFVAALLPAEIGEAESLHHFDDGDSLMDELDALIEEYGDEASAVDFLGEQASEALSRVIEAAMDEAENPPTLQDVRDAVSSGLVARLVAQGTIEEDEDETVVQEIDDLIDRFGTDVPAEDFLRYE